MRNKRALLILVCALSAPLPSTAYAFEDMFGLMFRMMLTMMNVMSGAMLGNNNNSLGNNWGNNLGGMNSLNLGMSAWPMMSGFGSPFNSFGSSPWSGSPWSSGWGNPFGGYPGGFTPPFGGNSYGYPVDRAGYAPGYRNRGAAPYPSASLIEGRWFGNSGEVLEVRGNRFRLTSGRLGLAGEVSVENNIISMYSPQTNTVMRYTFVRNQSVLLLQGVNGEVLRFTRYLPGAAGRWF
jgi:hypothetical protein